MHEFGLRGAYLVGVFKKYMIALFVVFSYFAGQIAYLTKVKNRMFANWECADAVALLLDLFGLAFLGLLLSIGLKAAARKYNLRRTDKVLDHAFLVLLVGGLLAMFPGYFVHHPSCVAVCWFAAALAIGYSFAMPHTRLPHYASLLCLVLSPSVLVVAVQIVGWETWGNSPRTEFSFRDSARAHTPIFIFLFDEWSYPRSTRNGEFRPFFENARGLANESVFFTNARSPYENTKLSVPRLLYQTDLDFVWHDGYTYWVKGGGEVRSTDVPSLYQDAKDRGYNTYLLACSLLPYSRILGDQADYLVNYPIYPQGTGVPSRMLLTAYRSLQFATDPLSQKLWRSVHPRLMSRYAYDTGVRVRREMFEILDTCPPNTFAFFHIPQPHGPQVFNPDGTYSGPSRETVEDYDRGLMHADRYLGQVIERLKKAGKYDQALIVVTSDHAFQAEAEPIYLEAPDARRWVPLFVKLPGQSEGHVVDARLCTNQLGPLFQAVLNGEDDTGRLLDLVQCLVSRKGMSPEMRRADSRAHHDAGRQDENSVVGP